MKLKLSLKRLRKKRALLLGVAVALDGMQGRLALRELGTVAIGWTVVKAPCVIDLGPPHGEERLLTLWTRRQPSGQVEELAFFFFSSILARSLS